MPKYSPANSASRKIDDQLTIVDLLPDTGLRFDVVIGILDGHHPTVRNRTSDRAYFFLEGHAQVRVGEETFEAAPGDLVTIPAGTPHGLDGTARYLIITSPPFEPTNEEVVA